MHFTQRLYACLAVLNLFFVSSNFKIVVAITTAKTQFPFIVALNILLFFRGLAKYFAYFWFFSEKKNYPLFSLVSFQLLGTPLKFRTLLIAQTHFEYSSFDAQLFHFLFKFCSVSTFVFYFDCTDVSFSVFV